MSVYPWFLDDWPLAAYLPVRLCLKCICCSCCSLLFNLCNPLPSLCLCSVFDIPLLLSFLLSSTHELPTELKTYLFWVTASLLALAWVCSLDAQMYPFQDWLLSWWRDLSSSDLMTSLIVATTLALQLWLLAANSGLRSSWLQQFCLNQCRSLQLFDASPCYPLNLYIYPKYI